MSGVTVSSPTPRRVKTPRWMDARLALGVVLVLASVLIGIRVVSSADTTYDMLAVTRNLSAGTVLAASDVRTVHVRLPDHGKGVYLSSGTDIAGKQLTRALNQGELLPARALGVAASLTTVTVPFVAGNAPQLARGQRVKLWLSAPDCPTIVLLGEVVVQKVTSPNSNYVSTGGQNAVFSIAPDLAARVVQALAIDSAVIRAGVVSGPVQQAANQGLAQVRACSPQSGSS